MLQFHEHRRQYLKRQAIDRRQVMASTTTSEMREVNWRPEECGLVFLTVSRKRRLVMAEK